MWYYPPCVSILKESSTVIVPFQKFFSVIYIYLPNWSWFQGTNILLGLSLENEIARISCKKLKEK